VAAADELTYDLRWFLLPEVLFNPVAAGLDDARAALRPRLPCLIREIDRLDRRAVEAGAKAVHERMLALGFFSGSLKRRPSKDYLEREVAGPTSRLKAVSEKAAKVSVFVFTDPRPPGSRRNPTERDCLRSNEKGSKLDCVLCASRFEAQRLARETRGRAIGIGATDGLDTFWRRLDRATKGRQITKLFVFGHGFPDGMRIGAGELKQGSEVPVAFQACRFARKAEIRFFGCHVGAERPWAPESFLEEIGKVLLCRGGSVTGFKTLVESECSRRGLRVRSDKAEPVTIQIAPCDPGKTLADAVRLLDRFVARGERAE
jgi:hypothetical protein